MRVCAMCLVLTLKMWWIRRVFWYINGIPVTFAMHVDSFNWKFIEQQKRGVWTISSFTFWIAESWSAVEKRVVERTWCEIRISTTHLVKNTFCLPVYRENVVGCSVVLLKTVFSAFLVLVHSTRYCCGQSKVSNCFIYARIGCIWNVSLANCDNIKRFIVYCVEMCECVPVCGCVHTLLFRHFIIHHELDFNSFIYLRQQQKQRQCPQPQSQQQKKLMCLSKCHRLCAMWFNVNEHRLMTNCWRSIEFDYLVSFSLTHF